MVSPNFGDYNDDSRFATRIFLCSSIAGGVKDTSCISYFIVARNCLAQPHAYVAMVVDAASAVEFRCAWKMRISARGSCDSCARI